MVSDSVIWVYFLYAFYQLLYRGFYKNIKTMRFSIAILLLISTSMATTHTLAQELKIKLTINNGHILTATMVNNSSTAALIELLKNNPLTIAMTDYGNMEKVGPIGATLPRNDEQITTESGDLILYQGTSFVIYYAPNSWNFTRLGKIDNITQSELKSILGEGNVSVTLELSNATEINEFQNINSNVYRIHPNPITGSFHVTGNFQTISLLDLNGNTLLTTKEYQMNISSFPNGTYLLKVVTMNNKVVYQKLLKV